MPWWGWVLIGAGLVGFVVLKATFIDRWMARRKAKPQEPAEEE